jgi:hypothetical protein
MAAGVVLGAGGVLHVPAAPREEPAGTAVSEHRYRLVGRIRLGLF